MRKITFASRTLLENRPKLQIKTNVNFSVEGSCGELIFDRNKKSAKSKHASWGYQKKEKMRYRKKQINMMSKLAFNIDF